MDLGTAVAFTAALTSATPPQAIAVIPILVGPEVELGLSAIAREIGAAAAWRPGLELIDTEELFVRDPDANSARFERCGGDFECLAEALKPLGFPLAALVVVNTEIDPPRVALRAFDPSVRKIVAEEIGSVPAATGTLADALRSKASRLFDALGFLEAGRLSIACEPANADLALEPAPIGSAAPKLYWVEPGRYRVTASFDGRHVSTDVDVAPRAETRTFLQVPDSGSESTWFWAGVAAGAAAIVTIIVVAAAGRDGIDACLGPPGTPCP